VGVERGDIYRQRNELYRLCYHSAWENNGCGSLICFALIIDQTGESSKKNKG